MICFASIINVIINLRHSEEDDDLYKVVLELPDEEEKKLESSPLSSEAQDIMECEQQGESS